MTYWLGNDNDDDELYCCFDMFKQIYLYKAGHFFFKRNSVCNKQHYLIRNSEISKINWSSANEKSRRVPSDCTQLGFVQ